MNYITGTSDTLINSLCREMEYIKFRSKSIKNSLENCQSNSLIYRLKTELTELRERMETIQLLVYNFKKGNKINSLSQDLLNEIIGRNLVSI